MLCAVPIWVSAFSVVNWYSYSRSSLWGILYGSKFLKAALFPLWQSCLFFAHTSLSFTFTWGVAYNYCLVNSFFCNIHDVQRQQSSKRSRGREVCSLLRMTNSHQGEKSKRNTCQSARPLSTSCPLFHHQVSLMLLVALSKWYPGVCGHIFGV